MELVVNQAGNPVRVSGRMKSYSLKLPETGVREFDGFMGMRHTIPVTYEPGRVEIEFTPMRDAGSPADEGEYTWFLEVKDLFVRVGIGETVSITSVICEWSSFTIIFPLKGVYKTYEELCAAVMRERIEESI